MILSKCCGYELQGIHLALSVCPNCEEECEIIITDESGQVISPLPDDNNPDQLKLFNPETD